MAWNMPPKISASVYSKPRAEKSAALPMPSCYSAVKYDPTTAKYGLMVTRLLSIGGAITILAVGSMIGFFVLREKNKLPLVTGGGTSVPLNN